MTFRGKTTGPPAEMAQRASRIACAEDFIADIENGGEDGYFVSSKWLLSLEEHVTESLMSVLRRAGYSGTYQTPTTTLFARIQKDVQYGIKDNDAPGTSTNSDVRPGDSKRVRSPKCGDDPSLEIAGETLKNIDLNVDTVGISMSQKLSLQSASSTDDPDSILAVPSEAENTPGNVLQQLSNDQYMAPTSIRTDILLRRFVHVCALCGGASKANAKEIWELMDTYASPPPPLDVVEHWLLTCRSVVWRIEQFDYGPGEAVGKMVETKETFKKRNLCESRSVGHSSAVVVPALLVVQRWLKESLRGIRDQKLSKHQEMKLLFDLYRLRVVQLHEELGEEQLVLLRHQLRVEQLLEEQLPIQEELLHRNRLRQEELRTQHKLGQDKLLQHQLREKQLRKKQLVLLQDKQRVKHRVIQVVKKMLLGVEQQAENLQEELDQANLRHHRTLVQHLRAKQQLVQEELQVEKLRGEELQEQLRDQKAKYIIEDQEIPQTPGDEIEKQQIDMFLSYQPPSWLSSGVHLSTPSIEKRQIDMFSSYEPPFWLRSSVDLPTLSIEKRQIDMFSSYEPPSWLSSSLDSPTLSIEEETILPVIEEEILPGIEDHHHGPIWKSFKAALQSKIHQSFCVSTQSLSNFKVPEEEALKAGYEKVRQTRTTTWFQKSRDHHVKNLAGGACDDGSYRLSNRNDAVNDVPDSGLNETGTSKSGNVLGQSGLSHSVDNTDRRHSVEDNEQKTSSFGVANELKKSRAQHGDSTCHPQLLGVACSSPSQTPRDLSPLNGHFRRQQFGDSVVTMPESQGQNISTTIEKPFSVMKIDFSGDGRGREVPIDLKAIVTTSLSCCLRDGHDSSKVRIKFSRISGDVKTEESYEESCNAMVLSSSYTSVYGCITRNRGDEFEQINLNLEDEYHDPPKRRVLATTSVDLLWLEISGRTPSNCEPGSVTLALKGDITERRKEDSFRQIQGVHPLLFQDPRPVIVGGDVNVALRPDVFLEFHIRSQLEVSYFKPWTPVSEEGPVWPANDTTKVIDFGCCLEIRAEDLRLRSKKKRRR